MQKRPIIWRSLLIIATPYRANFWEILWLQFEAWVVRVNHKFSNDSSLLSCLCKLTMEVTFEKFHFPSFKPELSVSSIDVATDLDHITAIMVCMCVFVGVGVRERESVCVCVCVSRDAFMSVVLCRRLTLRLIWITSRLLWCACVCVCVCVCERERERARVCVCVCVTWHIRVWYDAFMSVVLCRRLMSRLISITLWRLWWVCVLMREREREKERERERVCVCVTWHIHVW